MTGGGESRMKWTDEQIDALHAELEEVRKDLKKTATVQYIDKTASRLYGNALDMAKEVTAELSTQLYVLVLVVFALRSDLHHGRDTYVNYMQPKLESTKAGISAANSVEKILEIYRNFTKECYAYIEALPKPKRSQ